MSKNRNSNSRFQRLVQESFIVSAVSRFSGWIYNLLATGFFGRFFSAYAVEDDLFDKRLVSAFNHDADRADAAKQRKRTLSCAVEHSRVLNVPARIHDGVLQAPFSAHGMFWLLFGTISFLCYYLRMQLFGTANVANAAVGAVAFVFSLPLLAVSLPFKKVLQGSAFISWIARSLGIRFSSDDEESDVNFHLIAVILAIVAGAATYWFSALRFIAGIVVICVAVTFVGRPEWGVCFSAAVLPWVWALQMSESLLLVPVALSLLGFLEKWIRGRRAFRWELMDAAVGALAALYLLYTIISCATAGALRAGLRTVLVLALYFMIVNLFRVREWLLRLKRILLFSGALSGVYRFVAALTGSESAGLHPDTGDWFSGVGFCFIVMILLSFSEIMRAASFRGRLYYGIVCAALLLGLCTSDSVIMLQILLLSVCLFWMLYSSGTLVTVFILSCPITAGIVWLRALVYDDSVGRWDGLKVQLTTQHAYISSVTTYRQGVRTGVLAMLRRYWLCGVGVGQSSFTQVYPQYAEQGLAGALSAHNTYLQTISEIGLPGLLLTGAVVLLFLQVTFGYLKTFPNGQSRSDMMACIAGTVVLLIAGFGVSLFTDVTVTFFTVLVMGFAVAAADSDARERRAVMSVFNNSNQNVDTVFSSFV